MWTKTSTPFNQLVRAHLWQTKGRLCLTALCVLGYTGAELLAPWPFKIIFDYVLLGRPIPPFLSFLDGWLQHGQWVSLLLLSSPILLIALLEGVTSYFQLYFMSRIGYEVVNVLRRALFSHLQRLSLAFHTRARSGELLTKVTRDTDDLKELFGESLLNFITHFLLLVGMCTAMIALNWKLSLVVLATLPLLFYSLGYVIWNLKVASKRQRDKEGKIASRISETLASVTLVQAFGREKYEEQAFAEESTATLEESVRTARTEAIASRSVKLISAVGKWAVLLFGSWHVLDGRMTPGDMLIFWSYVGKMYKPIQNLVKLSAKFTKAQVRIDRINDILETHPDVQDDPNAVVARNLRGDIVFDNVSFDYGDGKTVLDQASFAIAPGQRVALVGASGAGKSTIVGLILRFYDPQAGEIRVDGMDVKRYQRESLRHEIGVVLQESILLGTTIRDNIAYGKPDATLEEIVAAAQLANAHAFISALDQGYDTVIGERGTTLSGGQRQRLAMARAFIRDAPILILDEPMTGLDVESEATVREALGRLMAGKTCLIITHDLEMASDVDWVMVLEDGRIVEQGAYRELAAENSQFRRLQSFKLGPHGGAHADQNVMVDQHDTVDIPPI